MTIQSGKVNRINLMDKIISPTAGWELNQNAVIPAGTWAVDSDTNDIRLGDGTHTYAQLKPIGLPPEYRTLLDLCFTTTDGGQTYSLKLGTNIANGLVIADENGLIRQDQLPDILKNTVQIIGTYGDMLALDASFHKSIIVVINPRNGAITGQPEDLATGDSTVSAGAAFYAWYDPDGEDVLPEAWRKIGEIESLDIDWSTALDGYFKYSGTGAMTLDVIQDGEIYAKATHSQLTKLDTVEAGADVTDRDNVIAAGALVASEYYIAKPLTASELVSALARGIVDATGE